VGRPGCLLQSSGGEANSICVVKWNDSVFATSSVEDLLKFVVESSFSLKFSW